MNLAQQVYLVAMTPLTTIKNTRVCGAPVVVWAALLISLAYGAMFALAMKFPGSEELAAYLYTVPMLATFGVFWYRHLSVLFRLANPNTTSLVPQQRTAVALASVACLLALGAFVTVLNISGIFMPVLLLLAAWFVCEDSVHARNSAIMTMSVVLGLVIVMVLWSAVNRLDVGLLMISEYVVASVGFLTSVFGLIGLMRVFPILAAGIWALLIVLWFTHQRLLVISFDGTTTWLQLMADDTLLYVMSSVLLIALTVYGLIGFRGDRAIERHRYTRRALDPNEYFAAHLPGYRMALDRALSAPASPTRLLPFVFGPTGHWALLVWIGVGLFTSLAATIILVLGVEHGFEFSRDMANFTVFMGASVAVAQQNAIVRSAKEQALLSLTPHWLPPGALNHALNRHIVWYAFATLMIACLGTWLLTQAFPKPNEPIRWTTMPWWHTYALFVFTSLLMLIAILKDYSRAHLLPQVGKQMLINASLIFPPTLLHLLALRVPSVGYPLMLVTIFALGIWAAIRYRRLGRGRALLPAGRRVEL